MLSPPSSRPDPSTLRRRAERFPRLVAAVLFLAVSAYGGAALFGGLDRPGSAPVRDGLLLQSLPLSGIALREERRVSSLLPARGLAVSGDRLPAGAALAEFGDGSVLTAERAAFFFSDVDGYEDLSLPDAESLAVSSVRSLLAEKPLRRPGTLGRLVYGDAWYFLALAQDAALPEIGSRVTLHLEDADRPLPARLAAVSEAEEGQRALLLRLTAWDEELLSLRKCRGWLILSESAGLTVPAAAVREDEAGQRYVQVLTAEGAEPVSVELLHREGAACLVRPSEETQLLRAGARVLLNPRDQEREG